MTDLVLVTEAPAVFLPAPPAGSSGPKGDPGSPGEGYSTRSAIAALTATALDDVYLTESGRRGKFVFESGDHSALVTADTAQGIYIAPSSDTTGASGAWVRDFYGPVAPEWFGAKGDGSTNDGPAFSAMKSYLDSLAAGNIGYGSAIPSFSLGSKKYFLSTTKIAFFYAVAIYGEAGGEFGGEGTILAWDASHADHGLEFTGSNWWIDGVALEGPHPTGTATEAEQHGIHATARGGWGRLWVRGWPGDGVHIEASVAGGTNANGCRGFSLTTNNNRNGVRLSGSDVNGGYFAFIDANYNRQAGYYDDGAFGNGIGTLQTSGNGVTGLGTPCVCFNSGHLFTVADGQATGASTNGPPSTATSNTWWIYCRDIGAATSYAPQWTTGLTWRCGGAIYTPNSATSNRTSIVHLYAEADQPVVQTGPAVMSYGGLNAAGWASASNFANPNTALGGLEISKLTVTGALKFIPKSSLSASTIFDARTISGGYGGDLAMNFYHGNVRTDLIFNNNSGSMVAQFTALSGSGVFWNCLSGGAHAFEVGGTTIFTINANGSLYASGKNPTVTEIAAASVPTPSSGTQTLFIDNADHKLKRKDSSGTVTIIA